MANATPYPKAQDTLAIIQQIDEYIAGATATLPDMSKWLTTAQCEYLNTPDGKTDLETWRLIFGLTIRKMEAATKEIATPLKRQSGGVSTITP